MPQNLSLAELVERGVEVDAFEAVAIARALIDATPVVVAPGAAVEPPGLATVRIAEDGTVTCTSCGITPSVSEVAILLLEMLRSSRAKPGGGLLYSIARALSQVDAPSFVSAAEFSRALKRYEHGEPSQVIRDLWNRTNAPLPAPDEPQWHHLERRQPAISVTELRRYLREADQKTYELLAAAATVAEPPRRHTFQRRLHRSAFLIVLIILGTALAIQRPLRPALRNASEGGSTLPSPTALENRVPETTQPQSNVPTAIAPASAARDAVLEAEPDRTTDNAPGRSSDELPNARRRIEPTSLVRAIDGDSSMFSPSFGPDGTAVFFHTGRTGDARSALMCADLSTVAKPVTEDLRVLTILENGAKNYHIHPSPDGTQIAFDSDRDGERGVYLANIDGTHVRRISGSGYAAVPTWSPRGDRLAFLRGEDQRPDVWNLWLYALSTGATERVTNFRFGQTWGASWFSDGDRICYSHEDRLFVHDLASRRSRQYTSPLPGRLVRTPAVSPDGTRVIFQVARHGAWLLDLTDGSMRVVLNDPTAEEFAWSPDGRRVAYHSRRDGSWGIWFTAGS
jgi:Tol biopolymer transport system component